MGFVHHRKSIFTKQEEIICCESDQIHKAADMTPGRKGNVNRYPTPKVYIFHMSVKKLFFSLPPLPSYTLYATF